MPTTVTNAVIAVPLLKTDIRPRMAKADLRKAEIDAWRAHVGRAIERTRLLKGWSLKELAAALERDERQISRWIAGAERPQLDVLLAVDAIRQPLIIALAEIAGEGIEVTTHIAIRRTA